MNFLNRLTLTRKLQALLTLMLVGFIVIASIGFINLYGMKNNIDKLYYATLLPSNQLSKIMNVYDKGIELSIYKYLSHNLQSDEAAHNIEEGLKAIHSLWADYSAQEYSKDVFVYSQYIGKRIDTLNSDLLRVVELLYKGNGLATLDIEKLQKNIQILDKALTQLVEYEETLAKQNHKKLVTSYDSILMQIALVILIICFVSAYLASYIFRSIQEQQSSLEQTSIKLKKSNRKLQESSYTDSLTNLYNRRYFNIVYEREFKRAIRLKHQIAFMMLDIDFFKQYNDTYGHLDGDETLKSVAKALKTTLKRPTDFVFRLGGEEFGVLLTETNSEEVKKVASNINKNIEALHIEHEKNQASDFVTISIGIVLKQPSPDDKEDTILSDADDKLYQAKEGGRNRYVL